MRIIALLLALLLPCLALAEEIIPYEVFTFSASLPQPLKEPLSSLGPDETLVLSGAAIQHNEYTGDGVVCYSAMALVQTGTGLRLYAAAQPAGQPWEVNDYTRLLRNNRNVSISVYQPEPNRIPQISIDYYTPDGLVSDLLVFWNSKLWCLNGHTAPGVSIANEKGMIAVQDAAGQESFRCLEPYFLDYMADISAFPTSREETRFLAWLPDSAPYAAGMTLYSVGANLRREPTGTSESLGKYARNVPMVYTGEQKHGTTWPWYQVRIGSTVGWMSGNYVADTPYCGYGPVPLGRTAEGCALYAAAGDKQPIAQLAPGTTFHILTEYRGMYHVCVPSGDISWAVDMDGLYGYVPVEGIMQGASPSALDARSAK